MNSKSTLAVFLSKLAIFKDANPKLEQYATNSQVAAGILWSANLLGDIEGKVVADLGAGTGILGIGAIELGAEEVHFVELDKKAFAQLEAQVHYPNAILHLEDVGLFDKPVDTVIMNPPFGVQRRNADKLFLEAALRISNVIYTLGKSEGQKFMESFCKDHNAQITHAWEYMLPLPATQKFHTKKKHEVQVTCWRIVSTKRR